MHICGDIHAFPWQSMSANNCNCFLIDGARRILIDPGHVSHFSHVENALQALSLELADIELVLCTHCHPDHMEAVTILKQAGARFALHGEAWRLTESLAARMGGDMNRRLSALQPDFLLQAGDLRFGDIELQVLHTPGHSPGSVCFYDASQKALVCGDLVFQDGIGRTDLPGGDSRQIVDSIRSLAELEIEHLLPGHGPLIRGRRDVQGNFDRIDQAYLGYL